MTDKKGRKPHYRVRALNKQTDAKGTIGAAWSNDNGTISIRLDPFIVLDGGKDIVITLFPEAKDGGTEEG